MARESSPREGPVGVRLPPDLMRELRSLAEARGSSVHAEIVNAVQAYVEEAEVEEIRKATLAMLAAAHFGLGDVMPIPWTLEQFKVAMEMLFKALNVGEPSAEQRKITEASVNKVLAEMRSERDTEIAFVGRKLGMAEEGRS